MRVSKLIRLLRPGLLFLTLPLAAAESAGTIVIVADTRNLTGLRAWWANLYNESHLYFTLLTILVIPISGAVLGLIADFLMGRIGIDLKSRALRES